MRIFRRTIELVQHMVSSLSLGDCSVHRLRECTNSVFYYIYYIPLHVSSTIMRIFRRIIVLVQHLVSSLSLGDWSVHRLQEDLCNERSPKE